MHGVATHWSATLGPSGSCRLGTGMDVAEKEQLTQELRRRNMYLAEAMRAAIQYEVNHA